MNRLLSVMLATVVTLLGALAGRGATRLTTSAGGNWNSTATWTGGVVPASGDAAVIRAGASVTVTAGATVNSIMFSNNSASAATLTVNSGVTLAVTTGITNRNAAAANTAAVIQGAGTINCASLTVGGTTTPTLTSSDFTATLTSTISNLSVSGNLTVRALYNSAKSAANQGVFALGSGAVNVGGGVVFVTVPLFGPTLTLASGSQNGTLTISGATPFTRTGGGSSTFTANGANATVVYAGAAQPVEAVTYQNLVFSGSGTKTNAGITVNGTLSMRGTAKASAAPTYGAGARLEYNGSAAQTSGPELTSGIANLTINNASGVTVTLSPTVSSILTLTSGKLATGANQINIASGGSISGGSAASYVNGSVQKAFNVGTQVFTFPIGDNSSYAPLTLSNLSVTTAGSLKAGTTGGTHPQLATSDLDPGRIVNRYWTLTQSGGAFGTYNATFNYPATDVDATATPAQFTAPRWSGGAWSATTVSGTPTTTSTSLSGQNGFGDFAIGNRLVTSPAQMLSGSYTGNGTDNRAITGIGFQPDVVIVKSAGTAAAVIRTSTMSGDNSKEMVGATALQANCIQSLNPNGFTVGTDARVNSSGVAYYWTAFKAGSGRMNVGTYTGNGSSNHAIAGVGFAPKFVFFMSAASNNLVLHSTISTLSYQLDAHSGNSMVASLDLDGFTLGSDPRVNGNAVAYHYVAWNVAAGALAESSYSGTGTDNRTVAGVGFQPEFVLIKSISAYAGVHHPQSIGSATDLSQYFTASINAANRIQALQSDGFQVGTAQEVNQAGVTYAYFAWKKMILPSKLAITSVNGGSFPAAGTAFSVVVQSQDAAGNPASVSVNTAVSLSLNTGGGTLGGTLTGTILAGTNSTTISGVTYTKAESGVILTASRTGGDNLAAGNSSPFTVNPGAFTKLQLLMPGETAAPGTSTGKTGSPGAQTVGAPFTVTVNAVDANWNRISTNDTVRITSTDTNAILPANAALGGGTQTFSLTFRTAGSRTVTSTDVTHAGITANTGSASTVNPGNQTVTFPSPGNQTYGVAPLVLGATAASGLPVSYSVTSGPGTVTSNVLTLTGAGSVTVQAAQPGNANWNAATPVDQTISVAPKTVTGAITANNKIYDATLSATIATRTLTGVINGDVVSLSGGTAAFADKNAGTGKTVTATGLSLSGANAGNYVLASTTATTAANITAATLTVAANNTNRAYGTLNPDFTVCCNGFVEGEGTNVLSGSPVLSTGATTNSPVGVYPIEINAGTLSSVNYTFNLTNGTLTVTEVVPVLVIEYVTGTEGETNHVNLYSAGVAPGSSFHVMASTNVVQWAEIGTAQAAPDGTITFTDADAPLYPIRWYRLSSN